MNSSELQQRGNAIEKAQEQKPIQGWKKICLKKAQKTQKTKKSYLLHNELLANLFEHPNWNKRK